MQNIEDQNKQNEQHDARKAPEQSCDPLVLLFDRILVKENNILIVFIACRVSLRRLGIRRGGDVLA